MSQAGGLARRWRRARQVLRDPRRKPLARILVEAAEVARRSRAFPAWYFLSFAYRRDTGPHTAYMAPEQYERLKALWHSEHYAVLEDKLRFQARFADVDCALPQLLAHNDGEEFHVGGDVRQVRDGRAFAALISDLCRRSTTGSVFMKPASGSQGRGCRRIDGVSGNLDGLCAEAVAGRWLFQETLVQHPALGAIYPHSVNTLRAVTCRVPGRGAILLAIVLRLGAAGRVVDNASQSGLFVGVDLATGRLRRHAHRFFRHGGDVHAAHPDTGFRFDGFEIPWFDAVLAMVAKAAEHVPHELVGWDIAVTADGPVLVEGNTVPDIPIMEIGLGRGLMTHPAMRELCNRLPPLELFAAPPRRPRLA